MNNVATRKYDVPDASDTLKTQLRYISVVKAVYSILKLNVVFKIIM